MTFILLRCLVLNAQDPYYYRIDKARGLPSNAIYDIFQDSKGFIWFSSGQGLCRYDGKRFVSFSSEKQTLKSGANIQEDPQGRIWYVNFDGYIYYVEGDSLKSFQQAAVWGYLRFGIVGNSLFCVEPGAIRQYDLSTLKPVRYFRFNTSLISATASTSSAFYVLTTHLIVFPEKGTSFRIPLPTSVMKGMQAPIMMANDRQLAIASKYAPDYLLIRNKQLTHNRFSAQQAFLQNLALNDDEVWFLTTNGLYRRDSSAYASFFRSINTTTVFRDRTGAYWVGTMRDGLFYIPGMKNLFYPFPEEINVMANSRDKLIAGSANDALYLLNPKDFSSRTIWKGSSNHEVYMLHSDTLNNRILFTSNSFKCLDNSGRLLADRALAVKDLIRTSTSEYALAASGFCASYKPDRKQKIMPEFQMLLNNVRGKSIAQLPGSSALLMATNTGLWMNNKGHVSEIMTTLGESFFVHQLMSYHAGVLAVDPSGKLFFIDSRLRIRQIRFSGMFAGETLRRIKLLKGEVYALAGNSLYRFAADLKSIERIFSLNLETELNDVAMWSDKVILATSRGYITLSQPIRRSQPIPGLVVNSLRSAVGFHTDSVFKLTANDRNLVIDFSIISFDPNVHTSLYYRLNEGQWQVIDDDRHLLELSNLDPGKYRLEMKCSNGTHFSAVKSVIFSVAYPFWMQWWFLLLIVCVLLLLLFRFDRWRTTRINRKSTEIIERIHLEKTANLSKLKAIKSQMNPHFFFNALNTIQSFILENDKRQAISFLNKFSVLTRSMLEMSDKDEVSVAEEIRVLSLYLDIEKVRFNDDFEYEFILSGFDAELVRMPSLLLQPYVENAVKHGLLHKDGHKQLTLSFVKEPGELRITIADNGVGRKRSAELNAIKQRRHKSFATDATEQRISLLNKFAGHNISIEYQDKMHTSGQAAGTTVIIKIPF